jgi:hypothetical protein
MLYFLISDDQANKLHPMQATFIALYPLLKKKQSENNEMALFHES